MTDLAPNHSTARAHSLRSRVIAQAAIGIVVAWICAISAPLEGLASIAIFAWFGAPGLILSLRDGQRSDTGTLIAWLIAGVAMTLLAIAIVGAVLRSFSPAWVMAVPAVLSASLYVMLPKSHAPEQHGGVSTLGHVSCLAASAMIGLALASPAWLRAGAHLDSGVNFQAYFSADFFKHLGIANGFASGSFPPQDLFGAAGIVHYYWLQHVVGGALLALMPGTLDPVHLLIAIGMCQTAAFGSLLFLWARLYGTRPLLCAITVLIALASLSMDGLATWLMSGAPWLDMQRVNMEAVDLGYALGYAPSYPAASTLYRLALYIPQHQLCGLLFISWAVLASAERDTAANRWGRIALVAAMPATSLLLGVPAVAAALLYQAMAFLRHRQLNRLAPEACGAVVSLILPVATEMIVPGATAFGLAAAYDIYEPSLGWRLVMLPVQWLTAIGVLMPAGVAGIILLVRRNKTMAASWIPAAAVATACLGYVATQTLLSPSRLRVDAELKISFLLAIGLVPAAAYAMSNMPRNWRRISALVAAVLITLGLPSLIQDTVWHSCRTPACVAGPERSTTIPFADYDALQWIRRNSGPKAVFQQSVQRDFLTGGRDVWIPVIAGRAVLTSHRSSEASSKDALVEVSRIFDPMAATLPSARASALRINYLYISKSLEGDDYDVLRKRFRSDSGLELEYMNDHAEVWHLKGTSK